VANWLLECADTPSRQARGQVKPGRQEMIGLSSIADLEKESSLSKTIDPASPFDLFGA
jgi:hypothetical protein